ncbi:Melibiose operon regulatory protein [Clostridiales bacterium CHKCI001]|nr:Melibiose operon regulatory protein [Clostridiales bacterium CHKCI001]
MKAKPVMEHKTSSEELHLISCGYEECNSIHSYGPAVRRYYTLHFILSGQGDYYINNKHYVLNANQCFLIPPDILTLYKADTQCPWTYVWVCFNGRLARPFLDHCHMTLESPIHSIPYVNEVKQIVFDMMQYPELTPANECYIQSDLYLLFAKLKEFSNASYQDFESSDNIYIHQAIDFISKNTFVNLTVTDVANYVHISRSYLFTLFKRHLNISPQKFLTATKISNARELLSQTDISITAIANSSGYKNSFAFSRAFKQEMGITPSEYRNKYRNKEKILDY